MLSSLKMYLILFLISILYSITYTKSEIPDPSTRVVSYKCYETDFWRKYNWNFQNSSEVTIIKLVTNYSYFLIEEFITEMMKSHNVLKNMQISFLMQRYWLTYLQHPNSLKNITEVTCPAGPELQITKAPPAYTKVSVLQERLQQFSADLIYAFHIVVWDVEDFNAFLVKKFRKVFPNPRGVYLVAFIAPLEVQTAELTKLFLRIWEDFGVLNVIFTLPCACNRKYLYTFDPFESWNNTWGKLKEFRIEEAESRSFNYRNTLGNLQKYPLKVSLFPRLPTAITVLPKNMDDSRIYRNFNWSKGFVGLDGMVLGTLAEHLNFDPVILNQEEDYGFELNGTFFGTVGTIAYRLADVSFNSRFVDGSGEGFIEYLTPVLNDKFCIIVPKAVKIPQWLSIFRCFDSKCWLFLLLTYVLCSCYWYVIQANFTAVHRFKTKTEAFLEVFSLFIAVPIPLTTITNHRLFLFACMIFSVIVLGAFQSQLITSFATEMHYPDINTLEDFEKSGLKIATSTKSTANVFGDDGTNLMRQLNQKIIVCNKSGLIKDMIAGNKVATFERKADATLRIKLYAGQSRVHICQECPRSYYFTYIVPKGSPYLHAFNIFITMFRESGLVTKWTTDITDALVIASQMEQKKDLEVVNMKFTLDNLLIPFCLLIGGLALSIAVFLNELFYR